MTQKTHLIQRCSSTQKIKDKDLPQQERLLKDENPTLQKELKMDKNPPHQERLLEDENPPLKQGFLEDKDPPHQ